MMLQRLPTCYAPFPPLS